MPPKKLNKEQLEEFIRLKFGDGRMISEINEHFEKKYGISISRQATKSFIRRAIKLNIITKEDYDYYKKHTLGAVCRKGFEKGKKKKIKEFGSLENYHRYLWSLGIGKNQQMLSEAGFLGGIATQTDHPEVTENLKKGNYKPHSCYYGETKFRSKGERVTGLLLLEYNLIKRFIKGDNHEKRFGDYSVDFFIEDRNLVVEYHPIPKGKFYNPSNVTEKQLVEKRKKELGDYFNGDVVFIISVGNFYKKLLHMGVLRKLNRAAWYDFVRRLRLAKEKIDYFEMYKSTMYKDTLEERVEEAENENDCPF